MNNTLFPELQALRIELADEVRDAQFEAIVAALDDRPALAETPMNRIRATWRKWAVSAAALTTALVPVAAVASESSVPGDLLYPVKLTVERIQLVFDRDIDAEHRVDELETLIGQDRPAAVVEDHIAETLDVLDETTARTDLTDRVDDAIDQFRATDRTLPTDAPLTDVPPSEPATDGDREIDRPTTTTIANRDEDVSDRTLPTDARDDTTTTIAPPTDQSDSTTTTSVRDDGAGDGGGDDGESDRDDSAGSGDAGSEEGDSGGDAPQP